MSEQQIHKRDQLKDWGFKIIQDGGECYYQKVLDYEDYFNSPFLYTEKVKRNGHMVYLWGKEEPLTEGEIVELLDQYNSEYK